MEVVWSLDGNVAIPVDNIKEFEIEESGDEYVVVVSYCICTGKRKSVFRSNDIQRCRSYIANFEEMRRFMNLKKGLGR